MTGDTMEIPLDRILVVEDEPQVSGFIAKVLEQYMVISVSTLADARKRLQSLPAESIHLIVLDANLPDSQGADTIREVRRASPAVPIVVTTGSGLSEEDAMQAGASAFVMKPFQETDLAPVVARLLASQVYGLAKQGLEVAQEALDKSVRKIDEELAKMDKPASLGQKLLLWCFLVVNSLLLALKGRDT